jgi:hypothetical protein
VTPKAQTRRGPTPGWETYGQAIRAAVAEAPDATLAEYRQRFALPLSKSALDRALAALGLSRKKSRSARRSRTGPTSKPSGRSGGPGSRPSTPTGSSSSTRRGPART